MISLSLVDPPELDQLACKLSFAVENRNFIYTFLWLFRVRAFVSRLFALWLLGQLPGHCVFERWTLLKWRQLISLTNFWLNLIGFNKRFFRKRRVFRMLLEVAWHVVFEWFRLQVLFWLPLVLCMIPLTSHGLKFHILLIDRLRLDLGISEK